VFIVPFLPSRPAPGGLIAEDETAQLAARERARGLRVPLQDFEHAVKPSVDWGLFLFAFCNAGVKLEAIGAPTWIVLGSLVVGKTVGISLFSAGAAKLGFPLPAGMNGRSLVTAGLVAGIGLTVALFVCGVAFTDPLLQGEAKMGALLSGGVFLLALVLGRLLGIRKVHSDETPLEGQGNAGSVAGAVPGTAASPRAGVGADAAR
jgi:NhaA family Na+:H+ antiporter